MKRPSLSLSVALVGLLVLPACAKNRDADTEAPAELDLPPENKVADDKPPLDPVEDEAVAAKPVEPGGKVIAHPQDRDPNQEKAKMKRSHAASAKAKQLLRSGQGDKAVEQARKALREHEQNVEAMLVIAEVFYKQGKHELVQSVTGSILKVDEKVLTPEEKSQAYNLMGFAYLQAGSRGEAYRAFKTAAETDDQNASAWNNLGVQYMWQGDPKTAESCFEYAISLDAEFAESFLNHGAALRANNKVPEAEDAYRRASKLRPDWAEVHFNLGVLYLDAKQIGKLEAIPRLETAIQEFERYKDQVSKGKSSVEHSAKKRGPTDAMGNELVSVGQADSYIKAANKAIASEKRRLERDERRQQREADKTDDDGDDGDGDENGAEAPAPAEPAGPQKPGQPKPDEPKPEPVEPKPEPKPKPKPEPVKPDKSKPKPKQPHSPQNPQNPAPKKPSPQKPKPQKPSG